MKSLAFCILIVLAAACTQKPADKNVAMEVDLGKPIDVVEEPAQAPPKTITVTMPRKLIKNGRVAFETDDPAGVRKQIVDAARAFNGYISSENEEKRSDETSYQIVVRVPTDRFDQFLASATKGVSDFRERSIEIEDVTEDFLDHEARVKSKKEIEARYRQLLNKASTVKDILEIEKEMGEIRTEIEASEGRLKYLNDQVQFSTLRITFYKSTPSTSSFSHEISKAFSNGWQSLRVFAVILVTIWPFVLLAILAAFAVRYFRKKVRRDKQPAMETGPESGVH